MKLKPSLDTDTLMQLVLANRAEDARAALAQGHDPNRQHCTLGVNAIQAAASRGCLDALLVLIEAGADLESLGHDEASKPLMHAAMNGHVDCMEALIQAGAQIDGQDSRGVTAAMSAAVRGCASCVESLARAGANLELAAPAGDTALHLAARAGRLEAVRALIAAGANLDALDRFGCTPAILATGNGWSECLALLSQAGADLSIAGMNGRSAPKAAALNGRVGCLEFLLGKGAPADASDNPESPPDRALANSLLILATQGAEFVEVDSGHGPDPSDAPACLIALIRAGADLNAVDNDGNSAAGIAASFSDMRCLGILIQAGTPFDSPNHFGQTPAMLAAQSPSGGPCLALLIQQGADIHALDGEGRGLMDIASASGSERCEAIVRSAIEREELERANPRPPSHAAPRSL